MTAAPLLRRQWKSRRPCRTAASPSKCRPTRFGSSVRAKARASRSAHVSAAARQRVAHVEGVADDGDAVGRHVERGPRAWAGSHELGMARGRAPIPSGAGERRAQRRRAGRQRRQHDGAQVVGDAAARGARRRQAVGHVDQDARRARRDLVQQDGRVRGAEQHVAVLRPRQRRCLRSSMAVGRAHRRHRARRVVRVQRLAEVVRVAVGDEGQRREVLLPISLVSIVRWGGVSRIPGRRRAPCTRRRRRARRRRRPRRARGRRRWPRRR